MQLDSYLESEDATYEMNGTGDRGVLQYSDSLGHNKDLGAQKQLPLSLQRLRSREQRLSTRSMPRVFWRQLSERIWALHIAHTYRGRQQDPRWR